MKNTGKCPKCNGAEIYTTDGETKRGYRTLLNVSQWSSLKVATYLCMNCGYIEEYADKNELLDEKIMTKIRSNYKKHIS